MWYTYTVELYSDGKKSEIIKFGKQWMELGSIVKEITQALMTAPYVPCHIQILAKNS